MRIVLDTNVLISSLFKRESTSAQILSLWRAGEFELLISPEVLSELKRVIEYPRVQRRLIYTEQEIAHFLDLLTMAGTLLSPQDTLTVVKDDPHDDKFVTLAVAGQAEYLVSGDNHLLNVASIFGVTVVTPRAFLSLWEAQRESGQIV
ncbi:MAG: putative toxin-antitoxin system toxin component, PIN family [Chloroflexi bacterium]|nr:putative toxin-antitoxin system toxin component, PIN family [Chloroflexota bacterium]